MSYPHCQFEGQKLERISIVSEVPVRSKEAKFENAAMLSALIEIQYDIVAVQGGAQLDQEILRLSRLT
jgi:hypothetical protein